MKLPLTNLTIPGRLGAQTVLSLMLLAIPLILFGAVSAMRSTSNDPRQWLPRNFDETDTYDWFGVHFGSDEIAVVSWPGCTLDDPRVRRLARAFEQSVYFDHVLSGPSVLSELTQPPLGLSRSAALRRLQGILIEPDGQTTCLVLSTSAVGRADRTGAVSEIENLAAKDAGVAASELRLAGPTVDAAAIDAESRRLLFQLAGFSALVSFLIAMIRLRSVRLAIMVLVVAGYTTAVSLAVLYYAGGKMNLLMTMLPPLIYVLTISSAVHLVNYYRDAARQASPQQALRMMVAHGWLPCVLAASTTGVGLFSLVMSKIEPIQEFGIYSALGVILGLAVLFLFLPAALHLFPPVKKSFTHSLQTAASGPIREALITFIIRHHAVIMVGCLIVMALCAWRLPSITSTVKLQDRFLPGSDAITDYQWLEKHIGPMVPLEVLIHFAEDDPRDQLEQLRVLASIQAKLHTLAEPIATMSAINLSPPLPSGRSIMDVIERRMLNSQRTTERYINANYLANVEGESLWRITVRANAIGDLDYGLFATSLQKHIAPLLDQHHVRGTYTGVIPLIYKAQRQLLEDLFRSFVSAFVVIALVLLMVLRSVWATILAMFPNLFPAVVIFGSVEWIGIPVQIGSVMTASAALGIAVDDTVHFLTWFRREIQLGVPRRDALRNAFRRCAGAMSHTTLICAGGLVVFAFSSFVPILHFAWLMVSLLLAALVGDLVLLPAILAGPFGRVFDRKNLDTPRP